MFDKRIYFNSNWLQPYLRDPLQPILWILPQSMLWTTTTGVDGLSSDSAFLSASFTAADTTGVKSLLMTVSADTGEQIAAPQINSGAATNDLRIDIMLFWLLFKIMQIHLLAALKAMFSLDLSCCNFCLLQ